MKETAMCCFIGCDKVADFQVTWGGRPDDHTESCIDHVGHLLGYHDGEPEPHYYVVSPIEKP